MESVWVNALAGSNPVPTANCFSPVYLPQMDDAAEVKNKADIVAVIGESVKLTRAGRNFKGLCPFHEEHTPSFMVSPELQIYKCFGCGESGDVFTFLQKHEGMDFYEALKYLADKVGVKLKPRRGENTSIKTQIIEANELAAKFYHYILTKHNLGKPGRDYLVSKRGISPDTMEKFNLGFAPQNKSLLFDALSRKKKIQSDILEKAGLVFKTRSGYMDRFRERVIFPITNPRGETIALAGRILPEYDTGRAGKYINSPETLVYHKSNSLYGFSATRDDIRKTRTAVVVEGELDFLSSWQVGIKNIVAIKGTALTGDHVNLLSRFAETLVMALDSDFAGDTAAIRGLSFAQNRGLEIKVVDLGKYKDPDEFARAEPDRFKDKIKASLDAWEFVINLTAKRFELSSGTGKAKASRQLVPILASIEDNIVRSHYIQKAATRLGVPLEAVAKEVEKQSSGVSPEEVVTPRPAKTRREMLEERLLVLALHDPGILGENLGTFLVSPVNLKIAREIQKFAISHKPFNLAEFGNSLGDELKEAFAVLFMQEDLKASPGEVDIVKKELSELVLKEKLGVLSQKLKDLEEGNDESEFEISKEEFKELSRQLSELTRETLN